MANTGIPRILWAADLQKVKLPLRCWVSAECAIRLGPGNDGDPVNYYQAIGDWLEAAGIVANDKQIRHWDGTRVEIGAENPGIDVRLHFLDTPAPKVKPAKKKGRGKRG